MGFEKLFFAFGQKAGPALRKGKWWWQSFTGSEEDAILAEHDVGKDVAREMTEGLVVEGHQVVSSAEIDDIANYLVDCVNIKKLQFNFKVIQGGAPNAFALPGGFIFVTQSLLDLCDGDAHEIAFVLGHEMAHVIRKHAMERMMNDAMLNGAMKAASRVNPAAGIMQKWIRGKGAALLQGTHSQDREFEADLLGVRLSRAGGFEGYAAIDMLNRLSDQVAGDASPGKGSAEDEGWWSYFATHPPMRQRIDKIVRYLEG